VTAAEYEHLAADYPNLVGTKQVGSDIRQLLDVMSRAPQLRHFLTELGFAFASLVAEPGLLMAVSASNPRLAVEFFEAGVRRDAEALMKWQEEIASVRALLLAAAGGGAHMDGARDKFHCKVHDPRFPLRLLSPYEGASDESFERYRAALGSQLPRWVPASGK
jgi:dihydrodipicolinate synthase/N-acetylneuraminate lyase